MTIQPGTAPWFEDRYRGIAKGRFPSWTDRRANPHLVAWLAEARPAPGAAAVVGCGLGDDAAALASAGFAVTAFDVAPTALKLAAERFPEQSVAWRAGDLLALPQGWRGAFDLVVEIYTLQAMPAASRPAATAGMAQLLAPGGRLFLLCRGRGETEATDGPPWPLAPSELDAFDAAGLSRESFEDFNDPFEAKPTRRFRAVWRRPGSLA